jgi:hypothetical protein
MIDWIISWLVHVDWTKRAPVFIPGFVYLITTAVAFAIRRDWNYLFFKDIPRLGPELCKISFAIVLSAVAVRFESATFQGSGVSGATNVWFLALILATLALFGYFASYVCFYAIDGKRIGGPEMTVLRWLSVLLLGQAIGIGVIVFVISAVVAP